MRLPTRINGPPFQELLKAVTRSRPDEPADAPVPNSLKDFEVVQSMDGLRALADATRLEIVHLLTRRAETGSALARVLNIPANRAHYHLRRLLEAGLIRDVGPERGRQTEERYFTATARHILVDPGLGAAESRTTTSLRQSIDATFSDWRRSQVLAIDWGDLARLVVHRSLRIGKDEQVLILFAPATLEAAEAILVEIEGTGAVAHLRPWSRNVILRTLDRSTPEELDRMSLVPPDLDQRITAVVFLTSSVLQGAPPSAEQQALLPRLLRAASEWKASARTRKLRYLHVGLPHRAEFGQGFLSPEEGIDTFWHCLTFDVAEIQARGERLLEVLRRSPEIVIEGKDGAELRVALDPSLMGVSDGIISDEDLRAGHSIEAVPAGSLSAVPMSGTGDGVFEADYTFSGGRHFRGLRVTLERGRIVQVEGPEDTDKIRERLARESGDPNLLSSVSIGLNSGGRGPTGRPELDTLLAGVVTLDFGNNEMLGGTVRSTFNLSLPANGLTVRSGTRTPVVRGHLALTGGP